jgi:hypothetical protein
MINASTSEEVLEVDVEVELEDDPAICCCLLSAAELKFEFEFVPLGPAIGAEATVMALWNFT